MFMLPFTKLFCSLQLQYKMMKAISQQQVLRSFFAKKWKTSRYSPAIEIIFSWCYIILCILVSFIYAFKNLSLKRYVCNPLSCCQSSSLVLLSDNKTHHIHMLPTVSKIVLFETRWEQLKKDIYTINCKWFNISVSCNPIPALAWLRATVFAEIMLHRRAILFHDINIKSRIWIVTKEKDWHCGRHTCNIEK